MTTGALIFAFNNEKTDYVAMAGWSAKRIHRYLDIPVAMVTDAPDRARAYAGIDRVIEAVPATGGTRYFEDYQDTVTWHNAGRVDAYALSPWDRTLVLDADYVVCGDQLRQLLHTSQDFLAHRQACNIAQPDVEFLDTFGRNRFPMWWATVMMFRKSPTAQYIFDCMSMIQQNWQHYRELYAISERNYRNDYALSIALGIVSGHTLRVDSIPWPLFSVTPETELTLQSKDPEVWNLKYRDTDNVVRSMGLVGHDFHAMGKRHLEAVIETY
jgi:hypothetical protein